MLHDDSRDTMGMLLLNTRSKVESHESLKKHFSYIDQLCRFYPRGFDRIGPLRLFWSFAKQFCKPVKPAESTILFEFNGV